MNKPEAFIVVSRYKENMDWIKSLTDNYLIYNKGESLDEFKQQLVPNFGGNQYDIFRFIYDNYENLPNLIAFVQGDPFDHCLSDRFYDLIYNNSFTKLFGDKNYPSGIYYETNTSWYINAEFNINRPPCKFENFDQYASTIFENYTHLEILNFPPGSQFIVEKERCLFYSKYFWKRLMDIIPNEIGLNGGRETHMIERSIQIIFENIYKEKN
jgi:hypothetical protein